MCFLLSKPRPNISPKFLILKVSQVRLPIFYLLYRSINGSYQKFLISRDQVVS